MGTDSSLGPQNTFVMNQGIAQRLFRDTLPVVVTAALCDNLLILAAVIGASVLLQVLPPIKVGLTILGIGFLIWMGWQLIHVTPAHHAASLVDASTTRRRIVRTLKFSLLNPHAIMDTVVVIGGGAAVYPLIASRVIYTIAACLVSWMWFLTLVFMGRGLAQWRSDPRTLKMMNRLSAAIMWVIAARYMWEIVVHIGKIAL